MVKGTVAVPKPELLLSTQSMEGAWLQGSGWQGSLLCQGYPHLTPGAAPHPAGLPHALRGREQGAGHSPQSSSWFVSPLQGAGLGPARDMQRSPTGTEELLPPGTARRGNLTALYKYHGVWGHADRLFKLKVRGARPHVGNSKCQQSLLWKGESGTNSRDQGRGLPEWPSPVTGSTRSVWGWEKPWLHWALSQLLPSPGKGWAVQAAPQSCLGTAPTPLSAVCWAHRRHQPPFILQPPRPRVPSPACHQCNSSATSAGPVAPCGEWLLVQWAPAFSIHVLMNHLTKMQPDSGWICSEQCGFVEGTTALCFPRQDPAAQPSCSTPARNQGSGGSPEESLGQGGWARDGGTPGCPGTTSQTCPNANGPIGLVTHHSCCRPGQPAAWEPRPSVKMSQGSLDPGAHGRHSTQLALASQVRPCWKCSFPRQAKQEEPEGSLAGWDPHW